MTAYRVIDDHKELDNVGSLTHDQIDTHVSGTTFVVVSGTVPPAGRLLTAGGGITIVDGGPGASIVISASGGGGGTPGGANTQVQFNDSGSFGGDVNFVFDKLSNTLSVTNLSGSLTRLTDGSSYLVAGSGVTISSGTNGSVTISTDASGTITAVNAGIGLLGGGTSGSVTLDIDDSVVATVSGATFTGPVIFNAGLSGSLTALADGSSYLVAGNNIVIASSSNGSVTISSTASGSSTPGGANTQVQFNDSGSFGGDANFVFEKSTATLTVDNLSGSLTRLSDGSSYIIAGNNVTVTSASNGAIVISATASGGPSPVISLTSWMETVSGSADGVNSTFSVTQTPSPSNSLMFYVNGVLQFPGASNDYTLSGSTITTTLPPSSGSSLVATYAYTVTVFYGASTSWMESPIGSVDGTNSTFTLLSTPVPLSALMFYVNGILQKQGVSFDYTITGNTVVTSIPPSSGSNLLATYPY